MLKTLEINYDQLFIATLINRPDTLIDLKCSVVKEDFSQLLYYDLYSSVIDSMVVGKKPTFPDLKLAFKDDPVVLDVISKIEIIEPVSSLQDVYKILIEKAKCKRIKVLPKMILKSIDDNKPSDEILHYIEREVVHLRNKSEIEVKTVSDIEENVLKNIETKIQRARKGNYIVDLPSGFNMLDTITLGFQKKNLWLLGASTSDGKTQMAVQMSNSVMKSGNGVLYFMLEDDCENLIHRFWSLRTGIKLQSIKTGNINDMQFQRIRKEMENMKLEGTLLVEDTSFDIFEITNKIKFITMKYNIGLVVVDYLTLVTDTFLKAKNREQEISNVSKQLLRVAKECNVCVLSLAQLNTNPDERSKGMPIRMNDLRDSKAPGHDSSVTLFINFPDKYKSDDQGKFDKVNGELIVAKNRNGEAHKIIKLKNKPEICKFEEI